MLVYSRLYGLFLEKHTLRETTTEEKEIWRNIYKLSFVIFYVESDIIERTRYFNFFKRNDCFLNVLVGLQLVSFNFR